MSILNNIVNKIDTDPTLAANSDAKVPSQKAVKSYLGPTGGGGSQYIKHALATTAYDVLMASGPGVFVKKTLAEVQAIFSAVPVTTNVATTATPIPNMGTVGAIINYNLYALATVTQFQTPIGSPVHGQNLNLSIYSATTWNITFSGKYIPIRSALPGTINAGKWTYLLGRYNSTATAYHILDVFQEV